MRRKQLAGGVVPLVVGGGPSGRSRRDALRDGAMEPWPVVGVVASASGWGAGCGAALAGSWGCRSSGCVRSGTVSAASPSLSAAVQARCCWPVEPMLRSADGPSGRAACTAGAVIAAEAVDAGVPALVVAAAAMEAVVAAAAMEAVAAAAMEAVAAAAMEAVAAVAVEALAAAAMEVVASGRWWPVAAGGHGYA